MNEGQVSVTSQTIWRHVGRYVSRHPWMLTATIACVFLVSALSRALPWIIGMIIDRAVLPKDAEMFFRLAVLYLVIEIFKTFFHFIENYAFQAFGNRMLFYVREDLYKHVLSLPLDFFNRTPVGRVVTRMTNDVNALGELFSDGMVAVFTQTVIILSTIVAMTLISWRLTLATLILMPVFLFIAFRMTQKIRLLLHETKSKLSAINVFLAENLSGIKIVQLYNQRPRQILRFQKVSQDYRESNLRMVKGYAWLQPILNLLNATLITSALVAGGYLHLENAIPLGSLITFLMYAQDFIFPIREILEKFQQFQNSLTSAERVFTLFNEAEEPQLDGEWNASLKGEIEIRNLTFQYRPDRAKALEDVSLQIKPGQSVALVGRTGSGKTTLVSLLQRFYEAPPESIFLDGHPLEKIPRRELRRRLGVIQQDPVLFRGSLAFNVALDHPEVTPARVKEACERVGLRLPLDLFVEERGANLSLGERQLVAFARIFAFNPEILILDEATANIDSETESLLKKATAEVTRGRTSILIAHRLSTIEHCDQVVVMDHGKVAEQGAPTELLKRGGLYAQLAWAGLKSTRIVPSAAGIADP